jgi:hypothetical protein
MVFKALCESWKTVFKGNTNIELFTQQCRKDLETDVVNTTFFFFINKLIDKPKDVLWKTNRRTTESVDPGLRHNIPL